MRRLPSVILLAGLLAGDTLFIGADILQRRQILHDVRFLVTHDRGYGEVFQYCKAGLGCLLLLRLALQWGSRSALTWTGLLAAVLLDDALELHEHAGERLAQMMALPSVGSLRANQVGELMFYAVLGGLALVALIASWWHAVPRERAISSTLLPYFAALGFCAIVLDAVSSLTRKTVWRDVFALLEDGGEMIVLSFLTAAVWRIFTEADYARRPALTAVNPERTN